MPLRKGKSRSVVSGNIKELMHSYKAKGTIGTSTPATKKDALDQSIAIAMKSAGKSRKKK